MISFPWKKSGKSAFFDNAFPRVLETLNKHTQLIQKCIYYTEMYIQKLIYLIPNGSILKVKQRFSRSNCWWATIGRYPYECRRWLSETRKSITCTRGNVIPGIHLHPLRQLGDPKINRILGLWGGYFSSQWSVLKQIPLEYQQLILLLDLQTQFWHPRVLNWIQLVLNYPVNICIANMCRLILTWIESNLILLEVMKSLKFVCKTNQSWFTTCEGALNFLIDLWHKLL